MTITIPWGDNSEDNFYIDYTNPLNPIVTSDDNNTQITRRKVIKYSTTNQTTPTSVLYLVIEQRFDGLIIPMFETTVPTNNDVVQGF